LNAGDNDAIKEVSLVNAMIVERIKRRVALTQGILDHRLRHLPVLILYPHSRCNCRCVMCDIWKANATLRELTTEELERHRDSLRRLSVRQAVLSGGEPLMHSNLFRFLRPLAEEGIGITLITTGLQLGQYATQVAESCSQVVVSLDGPGAVHDRVRGTPGTFDRLARGIRALKTARDTLEITGRCTVQQLNFRHLADTVDAALELGLSHISFLPADTTSRAFNHPDGWSQEKVEQVAPAAEDLPAMRASIEELLSRHAARILSHFVCESPAKLRRLAEYFAALRGFGNFPPLRCHAPWMSAVIDSNGMVLPCFFHPAYGHLQGHTLEEVLNSPAAVDFRRHLDVSANAICRRCTCSIRNGGVLDRLSGGSIF
jgi:Fe-coproporphyrin III synthase